MSRVAQKASQGARHLPESDSYIATDDTINLPRQPVELAWKKFPCSKSNVVPVARCLAAVQAYIHQSESFTRLHGSSLHIIKAKVSFALK